RSSIVEGVERAGLEIGAAVQESPLLGGRGGVHGFRRRLRVVALGKGGVPGLGGHVNDPTLGQEAADHATGGRDAGATMGYGATSLQGCRESSRNPDGTGCTADRWRVLST